jgi:hypothetical protein
MPAGGVFNSGSPGLKLQPTTPGTPDSGNANITGTIYSSDFRTHLDGINNTACVLIGSYTMGVRTPADWGGAANTMVGESISMGSLAGNTAVGNGISVGSGLTYSAQNSVFMGNSAGMTGAAYGVVVGSVAIGNSATVGNANQVSLGNSAVNNTGSPGTTVIGASATSTYNGAASYNVVIGYGEVDSGRAGVISIGWGAAIPTANCIRIGKPTMTNVQVGAYNLGYAPLAPSTVAGLPAAASNDGVHGFVTDALAPVWNAAVAGGGAVHIPVFSDGATWRVG